MFVTRCLSSTRRGRFTGMRIWQERHAGMLMIVTVHGIPINTIRCSSRRCFEAEVVHCAD
jgi:hypothetical protein